MNMTYKLLCFVILVREIILIYVCLCSYEDTRSYFVIHLYMQKCAVE